MKKNIFIVGISTEVGKTIASSIIVKSLQADYWKPIQSGDLDNTDTMKVKKLTGFSTDITFHQSAYEFSHPASPHLSAALEGITIDITKIIRPKSKNHLVIEGAGGIFVPLNRENTMLDLIKPSDKVILISRHYLGSINHTILSVEVLKAKNISVSGIIFSGKENPSTEEWIENYTNIPIIGRIDEEPYFNEKVIEEYSELFYDNLTKIIS